MDWTIRLPLKKKITQKHRFVNEQISPNVRWWESLLQVMFLSYKTKGNQEVNNFNRNISRSHVSQCRIKAINA